MIEQLIFAVITIGIFAYFFYNIIKNNDTSYVIVIILQALALILNFFEVIFKIKISWIFVIIKYIIGIFIPVAIMILEKYHIPFTEIIDITKANIYLKFEDNKRAKQALIHLVTKYPENYQGHKRLAEIYENEGGMRKAIDEYVQAIDIHKRDYDSYFRVAQLLNDFEKQDEAAEMLTNLLKKKPDYCEASLLLGDILSQQEMYKEATSVYQEALKHDPTNYDLYYNLGIAYTMLNDFENAKICYEKAADINHLLYNAKYSLAEIALIYKEIEEAQKYFMQVIEDEELAPDAYFELAKIELIKGNKDTAIQYANTAIDANAKKIVPKIKNEPMFIPILAKITIPFNLEDQEEKEEETKISKKGIKAKEHLEKMFEITKQLGYTDIEMLNRNKQKKQQNEQEINSSEQEKYREY